LSLLVTVSRYVPGFHVPVSRQTAEVAVWAVTVSCMPFNITVGVDVPKLVPEIDTWVFPWLASALVMAGREGLSAYAKNAEAATQRASAIVLCIN
jgi:hypothetical protein